MYLYVIWLAAFLEFRLAILWIKPNFKRLLDDDILF